MDDEKKNYSNDQILTSNFMLKLMKKFMKQALMTLLTSNYSYLFMDVHLRFSACASV